MKAETIYLRIMADATPLTGALRGMQRRGAALAVRRLERQLEEARCFFSRSAVEMSGLPEQLEEAEEELRRLEEVT